MPGRDRADARPGPNRVNFSLPFDGDAAMGNRPEVTELLDAVGRGEADAQQQLFSRVYDELKRIARGHVRRSGGQLSINPTTLLHEAWLKFARAEDRQLSGSTHFYNLLAQAMRQVLLDLARRHATDKHGRGFARTELTEGIEQDERSVDELLAVDTALGRLRDVDSDLAQLVEWHFFAGLSFVDIARVRNVTERTVRRHWDMARAFLGDAIRGASAAG
jgi:RNA polymerase sigma factor (TIGR02999 family)